MFIDLPLTLFFITQNSKYSEPGYIEHLRTLNTFSFPVSVHDVLHDVDLRAFLVNQSLPPAILE